MHQAFYSTAIFIVIIFFLIEYVINQTEHKHVYDAKDTASNLLIGIGLLIVSFINKLIIPSFFFMVHSFRLFTINENWFTWILLILLSDFSYYWYHRTAHSVNWFWSAHSVHHSSENFNISIAFRQSWMVQLSGEFLFWTWLVLLGFHPLSVYLSFQICQLYQSWLHTELIHKLPAFFEFIFNTPSHHRVHHGSDLKYLDKNHGGIFIIWDRLFGTFKVEEEHPTYGLTTKRDPTNLFIVMWNDWISLFQNIRSCSSMKEAINYLIQPPGWSPNGTIKS